MVFLSSLWCTKTVWDRNAQCTAEAILSEFARYSNIIDKTTDTHPANGGMSDLYKLVTRIFEPSTTVYLCSYHIIFPHGNLLRALRPQNHRT